VPRLQMVWGRLAERENGLRRVEKALRLKAGARWNRAPAACVSVSAGYNEGAGKNEVSGRQLSVGDGAAQAGNFHESLKLLGLLWKLPVHYKGGRSWKRE
jgi:hypothetical protein